MPCPLHPRSSWNVYERSQVRDGQGWSTWVLNWSKLWFVDVPITSRLRQRIFSPRLNFCRCEFCHQEHANPKRKLRREEHRGPWGFAAHSAGLWTQHHQVHTSDHHVCWVRGSVWEELPFEGFSARYVWVFKGIYDHAFIRIPWWNSIPRGIIDWSMSVSQAAMHFNHSIPWNRCQPTLDCPWKWQERQFLESMRELLALLMLQWQLERLLVTPSLRDDLRLVLAVLERRVKFLRQVQPPTPGELRQARDNQWILRGFSFGHLFTSLQHWPQVSATFKSEVKLLVDSARRSMEMQRLG